jgi:cation diffusion facilitator CzcD-associated flavoprotein CzcO
MENQIALIVGTAVDEGEGGWMLTVEYKLNSLQVVSTIHAKKLIMATGLTYEPFMPTIEDRLLFGAPIYHSSELAKAENGLGPFRK